MYSHLMKASIVSALLLGCTLVLTGQSHAGPIGSPVTLASLLQSSNTNPSIQVGDKKFDTFTFAGTGDMPPAANINVIPITDADGNFGVRFQAAFIDLPGGGGSDALITFKVTVTNPEPWRITDAHLSGNPNLLGNTGSASVTETFIPDSPLVMEIHDNGSGQKLSDKVDFPLPGFRTLNVQKDILLFGGDAPATISFVDQTFSQVPEATTAFMSVVACCGLVLKRRRTTTRLAA